MKALLFIPLRAALILLLLSVVQARDLRPHPEIKWREISSGNLLVIFPRGYESEAAEVLSRSGAIQDELIDHFGLQPVGRIRIVLSDSHDQANGFATMFPYSLVGINLQQPGTAGDLHGYGDWLNLVLRHELTHVYNLNTVSGLPRFLSRMFGRQPLFYPLALAQGWLLEGLAVLQESRGDPGGRLNTPPFRRILETLAGEGRIPTSLQAVGGDPTGWPGPRTRYLYGAFFFQFLAENSSLQAIPDYLNRLGGDLFLLLNPLHFRAVFGMSQDAAWRKWRRALLEQAAASAAPELLPPLTGNGFEKTHPHFLADGSLLFAGNDFKSHPAVWLLEPGAAEPRRLVSLGGITGISPDPAGGRVFLSALTYHKKRYLRSDLYSLDPAKGRLRRLSRGLRLSRPALLAEGEFLALQRLAGKSALVRYNAREKKVVQLSRLYDNLDDLVLSPCGKRAAVAVKQQGGNWRIALFSIAGEHLGWLTEAERDSFHPRWLTNEEILYLTEQDGKWRLARLNTDNPSPEISGRLDLPHLQGFALRNDGALALLYTHGRGRDLGLLSLSDLAPWIGIPRDAAPTAAPAGPSMEPAPEFPARRYRFLRDTLPRFWTPLARQSGSVLKPGLYTSGSDALGVNSFALEAYWDIDAADFDLFASYSQSAWLPGLSLGFQRETLHLAPISAPAYQLLRQRWQLGMEFPLLLSRRLDLRAGLHAAYEQDSEKREAESGGYDRRTAEYGLTFSLSTARTYYDSISESDGIRVQLNHTRGRRLNFQADYHLFLFEGKFYLSLLRPNVLAGRLVLAESFGPGRRLFFLGGRQGSDRGFCNPDNAFNLFRSFPAGARAGFGGWTLNLEYRLSLLKIERSWSILPTFERLFAVFFMDTGNLWAGTRRWHPETALGAELTLVVNPGMRLNLSAGYAVGINAPSPARQIYLRLGGSF